MLDKEKAREIAQEYTEEVCRTLNPKSVILFGSYANGTPHEYSDIDIAVVFEDYKGDWYDTAVLLQRLRRNVDDRSGGGIEPHLLDESNDRSGFLSHVKKTGEFIYQRQTRDSIKQRADAFCWRRVKAEATREISHRGCHYGKLRES